MYTLTTKGQQELNLHRDTSDDELRLARRTLIVPILQAVENEQGTNIRTLSAATGFDYYTTLGTVRALLSMEMISGSKYPNSPRYRTPQTTRAEYERAAERYPEVIQARQDTLHRHGRKIDMRRRRASRD